MVPKFKGLPRNVLLLLAGSTVSSAGSMLTSFGMDVWLFQKTGSYSIFALLVFLASLSMLAFSPFAGVISDRFPRKKLLICCELLAALVVSVVLPLKAANLLGPIVIAAVTVALGLINAVVWPSMMASITSLTDGEERVRANGFAEALTGATMIGCPILGGFLVQSIGLGGIVVLDISSFLVCALMLSIIRFPVRPVQKMDQAETRGAGQAQGKPAGGILEEAAFGFRWIFGRRGLTILLLFFALTNIGFSIFSVALTPYVLSFGSTTELGICIALGGAGIMLGGLAFSWIGGMQRHEMGIVFGAILSSIFMIGFGFARSSLLGYICVFGQGFSSPWMNASSQTIWQMAVPEQIQGKVFAVRRMIAWGLNPFAILLSVPLAGALSSPWMAVGDRTLMTLWGTGQSGALGLMVSSCGLLVLLLSLIYILAGGLSVVKRSSAPREVLG